MDGRKRIDDALGAPFIIEVAGERFRYSECYKFAEISNMLANIDDTVLKTHDGRLIRLTVVGEGPVDAYGIHKGWYTARMVDADEAHKWRDSWAVLMEQPELS